MRVCGGAGQARNVCVCELPRPGYPPFSQTLGRCAGQARPPRRSLQKAQMHPGDHAKCLILFLCVSFLTAITLHESGHLNIFSPG